MAYVTRDEVRLVLKGVYDQPGEFNIDDNALSNDAVIDDAIADASSQINAAIRRRGYPTPLPDPAPDIVKHVVKNVAAYLVDLTIRGQQQYSGSDYPFRLRYERARETLRKIETGFIDIFDLEDGEQGSILINPPAVFHERDVFPRGLNQGERTEFGEGIYIDNLPYWMR